MRLATLLRLDLSGSGAAWRFLFLGLGDGNGEIFEGQLPVVLVELFGLLAMHYMVQVLHEMLNPSLAFLISVLL